MGNDSTVKKNGITYHYTEKIKPQSQAAIEHAITRVFEKSRKNISFFYGLKLEVQGSWDETKEFKNKNYWEQGFTYDPAIKKVIHLKTNRSSAIEFGTLFHPTISNEKLEENALHELGHLFNTYFANPDKELKERLKELYLMGGKNCKEIAEEYTRLNEIYCRQNGLSDSKEFKEAWRKDVNNAFKGKSRWKTSITDSNLGYFSPIFEFSQIDKNKIDHSKEITLNDGIDDKELDCADLPRDEIFSQLFAFAMGACGNERYKHYLVNTYKYSYEVVKKYINEYLGTNTKGHYVPRTQSKFDCNG